MTWQDSEKRYKARMDMRAYHKRMFVDPSNPIKHSYTTSDGREWGTKQEAIESIMPGMGRVYNSAGGIVCLVRGDSVYDVPGRIPSKSTTRFIGNRKLLCDSGTPPDIERGLTARAYYDM